MKAVTPYEVREHVKRLAHSHKSADGAELVMLMHFERSREAWRRAAPHPDWPTYAGVYAAQPSTALHWGDEIAAELRRRYPGRVQRMMPDGYSYWGLNA